MAIKHNQKILKNHFRKDWQRYVRVHFDQAGKKKSRRDKRVAKAAKIAPRPVDKLRPVVRCPTVKYNRRVRAGRGFSLAELKAAGIPRRYAPTVGIAVDPRRQNLSEESLKANVERLQEYTKRLIVFPRNAKKAKKGDASEEEVKKAKSGEGVAITTAGALPIKNVIKFETAKVSDETATEDAYKKLRMARSDARLLGKREKRAKNKEEEAANAKK